LRTGVHCDRYPGGPLELHLGAFKHKKPLARSDAALDVQHLLSYDREDLQINTVELVEASPRPGGRDKK